MGIRYTTCGARGKARVCGEACETSWQLHKQLPGPRGCEACEDTDIMQWITQTLFHGDKKVPLSLPLSFHLS